MEIECQVFPLFSSFIRDLGKTYPEIKSCLYRTYEDCIIDDETTDKRIHDYPKLQVFLDIIHEHNTLITNKDETFFETDNILEEISFKNLWQKNISDKTRMTMWKYFQTFGLLAMNLKSSQALKDALSSIQMDEEINVKDKDVAKQLKQIKELTQSVQEPVTEEAELDLENMVGGMMDSDIGKIAQEVAGSLDMESMFGSIDESTNPMELMSQMMDPNKMGKIFQNINTVMERKVESGELNTDTLKKEAEGMYGSMSQNSMFQHVMGQMQSTEQAQAGAATGRGGGEANEISKEEKRKLLKAKIKEKSEGRQKQ